MTKSNSLDLIKRIKSLAETGLIYHETEYDKERYEELLDISLQLLSVVTNQPIAALNDFFMPASDYPTPKVDIRGFIMNETNEITGKRKTGR